MIHISQARALIGSGDSFDLSFFTIDGEIINVTNAISTSSHFNSNTIKIKLLTSEQFRQLRALLIFNLSGEEIYL